MTKDKKLLLTKMAEGEGDGRGITERIIVSRNLGKFDRVVAVNHLPYTCSCMERILSPNLEALGDIFYTR